MFKNQRNIEQAVGIAIIIAILIGCILVLKPFMVSILWAAILCFATWPVYEFLLKRMPKRVSLAAGIMTMIILLFLFVPVLIVGLTFTDNIRDAMDWLNAYRQSGLPPPPQWLAKIPLIGTKAGHYWAEVSVNSETVLNTAKPWLLKAGAWLLQHSLGLAHGVLQLAMSVLISFFFYKHGLEIAVGIQDGFKRIGGDYSQHLINVAKGTVQSVVYGIIGSSAAQGIMAGIGFAIAGVPSPVLLALVTFFFSFIPAGPVLIWAGAAVWLFSGGHIGWGIFMIIYGILGISSIDNVVRPYIISRGAKISFIIMLIGVLGGITAFGVIGVFIGPTLLTVGYTLTKEIISRRGGVSPLNPEPTLEPTVPSPVEKAEQ